MSRKKDEAPTTLAGARRFRGLAQEVSHHSATVMARVELPSTLFGLSPSVFSPQHLDVRGVHVHFKPWHVVLGENLAFVNQPERFRHLVRLGGRVVGLDQHGCVWDWPRRSLGDFPV